jgi:large subunit ribosomal protein L21
VYAVIRSGGKQYKVQVGDEIDVEHVAGDGNVELVPLLVVDDDGKVSARPSELVGAKVTASVVGHHRGDKVRVFTYKNKSGQRRHQGHRQSLTRIKVEGIDPPDKPKATATKAKAARPAKDKDAEAKAKPARATAAAGSAKAESRPKAESGAKAETEAKQSGAKAKDATTKAKPARAAAKDTGGEEATAKDTGGAAAAKPAGRSGRTRAKQQQDEEN